MFHGGYSPDSSKTERSRVVVGLWPPKERIVAGPQQISLRVGQMTLDNLNYLGFLTRQSQAHMVAEWINTLADTVRTMAEQANLALRDDPQFLKNGGTIISLEEQQAVAAIGRTLRDLRIRGVK